MNLQVSYNATTKVALVQPQGAAVPGGSTKLGEFHHDDNQDLLGEPESENHVIFHHVRDMLYKVGQQNMQVVQIVYPRVTGLSTAPATVARTVGQTQQITPTFTPTNAVNKGITYVSDKPTVATVNASGLITAVAAGTATITATATDGGWRDTTVVTVT